MGAFLSKKKKNDADSGAKVNRTPNYTWPCVHSAGKIIPDVCVYIFLCVCLFVCLHIYPRKARPAPPFLSTSDIDSRSKWRRRLHRKTVCACACAGLVPEPAVQREADEAAERAGSQETRLLPEPEADEAPDGPAGTGRADPQRALLLLRR